MRGALADFGASLNRVRALADSIATAKAAALSDAAIRQLHETQQCGAIVLLSGYFEAFLKDLVRAFIRDLSASGITFLELPPKIRDHHFEGGGDVLTKASEFARKGKSPPFGSATREDIAARLHSPLTLGGAYQIVWEAFANTQGNANANVVKGIAERLGLKDFWRAVSQFSGNPSRWSDSALIAKLNDLITIRHACAHTGTVSPIPGESDLLDFADMLEAISTGFVGTLEAKLASLKADAAPCVREVAA